MSEYLSYRFERLDGKLSTEQRQALRAVSSRADITQSSFSVDYRYSDLKAQPVDLMQQYFDIGFHYTNWGDIEAYIKLPRSILPEALMAIKNEFLEIHQNDDSQLLVFCLEEYDEYFDEDDADDFFGHLVVLWEELIEGDYRLPFLAWCKAVEYNYDVPGMPLINFDFERLSQAQCAFVKLFDVPMSIVRALSLFLNKDLLQSPKNRKLSPEEWVSRLTDADKDNLIYQLFETGQLNRLQAISLIKRDGNYVDFEDRLTASMLKPYVNLAREQIEQERLLAEAQRIEQARMVTEQRLAEVYAERDSNWACVEKEASRGCASGYDKAAALLIELFEAYSGKRQQAIFSNSYRRFIRRHQQRKALLRRLESMTVKLTGQ